MFFFCFTDLCSASLLITEVHPKEEYLEIFNPTTEDIPTSNWKYSEQTSSGGEKKYDFPDSTISAGEYFIIPLSRKINDSGDTVSLYLADEPKDTVVIPSAEYSLSYQLIENEWIWEIPSMGEKNSILSIAEPTEELSPKPSPSSSSPSQEIEYMSLEISEIFPNPSGSDTGNEWIELYNPNEESILLKEWSIQDASGKEFVFGEITLGPLEYKIFTSTVSLNNSNEELFLIQPNGSIISRVMYEKSIEDQSIIFYNGQWKSTQSITPNAQNIYQTDEEGTEDDGESINTNPFSVFSEAKEYEVNTLLPKLDLKITAISPNSSQDFIEVFCRSCNQSLRHVKIGTDGLLYEISEDIVVKTGEKIRFVFEKEGGSTRKQMDTWIIYIPKNGLTSTDETVWITDPSSNILDAMCYTNYDGYFPSQEKKDLSLLLFHQQWSDTEEVSEYSCVHASGLARDGTINRVAKTDTNTKNDWSISTLIRDEKPKLQFQELVFSREFTSITIANNDTHAIPLHHYFISNKKDHLLSLSTQELWIQPHQNIQVMLPKNTSQKYLRENMTLELRDGSNQLLDFFCINLSSSQLSQKDKGKAITFINKATHQGVWKHFNPLCASWSEASDIIFKRINNTEPASLDSYQVIKEDIISLSVSPSNKEDIPKVDYFFTQPVTSESPLSIVPQKDKILFSGKVDSSIRYIEFSIPKRNLQWTEKVKKGEVISYLEYPLKKRRYAVDIVLIDKDKTRIPLKRKRFFLPHDIGTHLLKDIYFSKVLPNPNGKDTGNEKIILSNPNAVSGWIKQWKIVVKGGKKEVVRTLPNIFIEANELRELPHVFVQSLRNTNAELLLLDQFDKTVARLSWEKARSGEWLGIHAPRYIAPIKKKTVSKKKSSNSSSHTSVKKTPPISTPPLPLSNIKVVTLVDETTSQLFFIDNEGKEYVFIIDTYFPKDERLFAKGAKFELELKKDGSIKNIHPLENTLSSSIFGEGTETLGSINYNILGIGWGSSLVIMIGVTIVLRRKHRIHS